MDPKHLAKLEEQKSLVYGDDGFLIFWPDGNRGAYTADNLREIAAYLDSENTKIAKTMKMGR